jgi:protein-S-isoprenylcysteine O-methyltransferase Ste14
LAEVPSLGARGGGWVVLQFVLMALVVVLGMVGPGWSDTARWWLKGLGVLLVFAGALVVARAGRSLGAGFTPFPRPAEAGTLVEEGPFAIVRHPVYSGGILVFSGISLALSPWALAGTAALGVLWALKARVEERFLAVRYPEYEAYQTRTKYRIVPYLY